MSTFVGIGLGPIQTGIFLAGASKGKFDRIVIAEVDDALKNAVNSTGGKITVNIAAETRIYSETYPNVEVYNPTVPEELQKLIEAAAEGEEFATALPSVRFFPATAAWLKTGFERQPERRRFIYTAENNNHAAEELAKAVGKDFLNTFYLNTVVGKMSGVVPAEDCAAQNLQLLCPGAGRAHLVEEFNRIYISKCDGIENRKTQNLYVKDDLYPFEEAKLYGHNAVHFLLGILGRQRGFQFMSELRADRELMDIARKAFIEESGPALCRKWSLFNDELFTEAGFKNYAEDLLIRMTNPFLKDAIARITRDIPRKLSWDDRVIGTMRVILGQNGLPVNFASGAALAAIELAESENPDTIREKLAELWPQPWKNEHQKLLELIVSKI
ncbi:MAG: hypothetical protein PHI56_06330 [Victivallaceae bacterium]|nr:hypothetical protein [Victivallaceae bacterium]